MERRFVKVEKGLGPQGRIAVVRFDRGDGINAFSYQAMRELRDVTRDFEDDLETSVVILTGSVHLGWHYAVDGYVSAAAVLLLWVASGPVLRRYFAAVRLRD